jgi:hypothetical protein
MRACTHVHMFFYTYKDVHVCVYTSAQKHRHVHARTDVFINTGTSMYISLCMYINRFYQHTKKGGARGGIACDHADTSDDWRLS